MKVTWVACFLMCCISFIPEKDSVYGKKKVLFPVKWAVGILTEIYGNGKFERSILSLSDEIDKALVNNPLRKNYRIATKYIAKQLKADRILNSKGHPMAYAVPVLREGFHRGIKNTKSYKQFNRTIENLLPKLAFKELVRDFNGHTTGLFDQARQSIKYGFRPRKWKKQRKQRKQQTKDEDAAYDSVDLIEKLAFNKHIVPKMLTNLAKTVTEDDE